MSVNAENAERLILSIFLSHLITLTLILTLAYLIPVGLHKPLAWLLPDQAQS